MKIYCGNKFHITCYLTSLHELGEIDEDFIIFSARSNSFIQPMLAKLFGLSTARYWTGNDSYRYTHDWSYRIRAKFINLFIDTHYYLAKHLMVTDGIVRILKTPLEYAPKFKRARRELFCIGYYDADGTFPNRYGLDVIEKCRQLLASYPVEFYPISPGELPHEEMVNFYHRIDLLLRPSRWDGDPFMVREAQHFDIPTISTYSNCSDNVSCDPDNVDDIVNWIKYFLWHWL
jgi:hypothetical protein